MKPTDHSAPTAEEMAIVERVTKSPQFQTLLIGLGAIAGVQGDAYIPVAVGLAHKAEDPTQIALCVQMNGPGASVQVIISAPQTDADETPAPDHRPPGATLN